MSHLAASETCARHSIFNFVNVTFVQTVKSLFNMKSRLLVLRSQKGLFQEFKLSMFRSMIQLRYPRCQKHREKQCKNNIQMPAEHSSQLNIRIPKLRRDRNHCGFLCACSLKPKYFTGWWFGTCFFP